jgi:hypothetical protein
VRLLKAAIAISLSGSTVLFVVWSWRWPLVGDASLIHYIAFLIERGRAPYRDLGDMNMPGSFLIEMAAMKVFGGGAVGWRVFDFSLLTAAGVAFTVMTRRAGWFAAVFSGTLFALVHGRDGLAQGGQRDLTMAVLLVGATACLMAAVRRWQEDEHGGHGGFTEGHRGFVGFGLLAGMALTIKPTALPLSLAQLGIAWWVLRRGTLTSSKLSLLAVAGMLFGPAVALGFLLREHAVGAFWAGLHGIVPYYASLGHRPLGYLLLHSISPLMALVLLWLGVLALARPRLDWERGMLLCGVGFGLVSYVVQARGLPYYRYPLLAFLLPLMAVDFVAAMELVREPAIRLKLAGGLALTAVCVGGLFLGPQSAVLVHRYRWWQTDFISSLEANLERLGGHSLSGQIQCVDSISGCGTTLYALRLEQQTGVLSDFLLFGPSNVPVIRQTRNEFASQVFAHPPKVIVVSSWLHIDGPGEYKKLERWPELETFLARDYRLDTDWTPTRMQRWWSREELGPGYRIYVRR